jgi:hypothetical protein
MHFQSCFQSLRRPRGAPATLAISNFNKDEWRLQKQQERITKLIGYSAIISSTKNDIPVGENSTPTTPEQQQQQNELSASIILKVPKYPENYPENSSKIHNNINEEAAAPSEVDVLLLSKSLDHIVRPRLSGYVDFGGQLFLVHLILAKA